MPCTITKKVVLIRKLVASDFINLVCDQHSVMINIATSSRIELFKNTFGTKTAHDNQLFKLMEGIFSR